MKVVLTALQQKAEADKFEYMEIAPLALYLLAAVLKEGGMEVQVIAPCEFRQFEHQDNVDQLCAEYLIEEIQRFGADMAAFSVNSFNWSNTRLVVNQINAAMPKLVLALGGLHATIFDRHVLEVSSAQLVMRGEGEHVILRVLEALEAGRSLATVPGITYREAGCIYRNEDMPMLTLEEMIHTPNPLYELLPSDLWIQREQYGITVTEELYDEPLWYNREENFYKTHPKILKADVIAIERRLHQIRTGSKRQKGSILYRSRLDAAEITQIVKEQTEKG